MDCPPRQHTLKAPVALGSTARNARPATHSSQHPCAWVRTLSAVAAGLLMTPLAWPQAAGAVPPELQPETLVASVIDPAVQHRVYVTDIAINHISDGRLRVFDATRGRLLGMISTAYAGNFTVEPQRHEVYVATTHLSRSTRGERTDVLEIFDTESLSFKGEVILPPKRAQALNYRGLVRANSSGQWVYVQNATPATSVTVVDIQSRKVVNEIATPGCWGILPAANHAQRLSMLCGDGRVATLTLDAQGQVQDRRLSDKLFDADEDAWFHHAEQVGDHYWFMSFHGVLTELDLGKPVAERVSQRELVGARDRRAGWRPGGYQGFAISPDGSTLVAGLHDRGAEGSHKRPARELWVFDLTSGRRLQRLPGHDAIAMTISRDGQRLQVLDGEHGGMTVWNFGPRGVGSRIATVARAGEASMQLETHD